TVRAAHIDLIVTAPWIGAGKFDGQLSAGAKDQIAGREHSRTGPRRERSRTKHGTDCARAAQGSAGVYRDGALWLGAVHTQNPGIYKGRASVGVRTSEDLRAAATEIHLCD